MLHSNAANGEYRPGAKQARVTLTDLAKTLGDSDKAKLKQLAERRMLELAEFGVNFKVKVTQKIGIATRTWEDPTFNPDQTAYLALSSETPTSCVH